MITRKNRNYIPGFYTNLEKNLEKENHHQNHDIRLPNNYNMFLKKLNVHIIKKLIYSAKTSPICTCKIDIGENIYDYLKQRFDVSGRFKTNKNFHESFPLKTRRFSNIKNYCDFDIEKFQVKIARRKPFTYYEKDMVKVQIKQPSVFSCKFIRRKHVI